MLLTIVFFFSFSLNRSMAAAAVNLAHIREINLAVLNHNTYRITNIRFRFLPKLRYPHHNTDFDSLTMSEHYRQTGMAQMFRNRIRYKIFNAYTMIKYKGSKLITVTKCKDFPALVHFINLFNRMFHCKNKPSDVTLDNISTTANLIRYDGINRHCSNGRVHVDLDRIAHFISTRPLQRPMSVRLRQRSRAVIKFAGTNTVITLHSNGTIVSSGSKLYDEAIYLSLYLIDTIANCNYIFINPS